MSGENHEDEPEEGIEKRDRGILTNADRQYLTGERELSGQSEIDARYRIRNRVKSSIRDFELLTLLDDDDREMIFKQLDEETPYLFPPVIHFVFQGMMDLERSIEDATDSLESSLEVSLPTAVNMHKDYSEKEYIVDVSADIEITPNEVDTNKLIAKINMGEGNLQEITHLLFIEEDLDMDNRVLAMVQLIDHIFPDELLTTSGSQITIHPPPEEEGIDEFTFGPGDFDSKSEYIEKSFAIINSYFSEMGERHQD